MTNFKKLGVPSSMMNTLIKLNFINPTPIQEQAIPIAMQGKDILGSAQTGTGKTAAFAIPMINHLLQSSESMALVLLPTRELAAQVLEATNRFLSGGPHIKSALLIGGDSMVKQLQHLKRKPRLIVGTPGRINDHLKRKSLNLSNTDFLVLDETDRMLDMGFGAQLNEIAQFLPEKRQTLMFSATMPKNIVALSNKYLKNAVRISVGADNEVAANVKQENVHTQEKNKYVDLVYHLGKREGSILVFVKTKYGADRLKHKLNNEGLSADTIHGDLKQKQRERVIAGFRNQNFRILVATDIAARGLDIPHIEYVINYDLPQCPEDYIHRIGRTGRADAIGVAINFLTPKESGKWKEIQKLFNLQKEDDEGFEKGYPPVSKGVGQVSYARPKNKPRKETPSRSSVKKIKNKAERNRLAKSADGDDVLPAKGALKGSVGRGKKKEIAGKKDAKPFSKDKKLKGNPRKTFKRRTRK